MAMIAIDDLIEREQSASQAPIDMSRPKIHNQDGSFSTEKTIGIEADGKHYNIPTIVNGQQLSSEEAIQSFRSGVNKPVGIFNSREEADSASVARSEQIGQVRSEPQAQTGMVPIDDMINRERGQSGAGGVIKTAAQTAMEPYLPTMFQKVGREAGEAYAKGREGILESETAKKMRESLPTEPVVMPRVPDVARGLLPPGVIATADIAREASRHVSPRRVGKEAQGVALDLVANLVGDVGAAKAPGMIARKIVKPLASTASKIGSRAINFYIKPRLAGYRFGKNPGKTVSEMIGPTVSREALHTKILNKMNQLSDDLVKTAQKYKDRLVSTKSIFEVIKSQRKRMDDLPRTYESQYEMHKSLNDDLVDFIIEKAKKVDADGSMYLNPEDAIKLKRMIGEIPSWNANDPKLGSITKTARKAYGQFDNAIDEAVPETKQINEGMSNLIGAKEGIELGMQREQNKYYHVGPMELLWGGGGFAAGHVPGAFVGVAASHALKSAPFNTTVGAAGARTGKALSKLGNVLESLERPTALGLLKGGKKPKIGMKAVQKRIAEKRALKQIEGPPPIDPRKTPKTPPPAWKEPPKQLPKGQGFELVPEQESERILEGMMPRKRLPAPSAQEPSPRLTPKAPPPAYKEPLKQLPPAQGFLLVPEEESNIAIRQMTDRIYSYLKRGEKVPKELSQNKSLFMQAWNALKRHKNIQRFR